MIGRAITCVRAGFVALVSTLGLAACGGGGGTVTNPPPPPPPPPPPVTAPSVTTSQVFTNLPAIGTKVAMKQAPGDSSRWFVVRQNGEIVQFNNDPNVNSTLPFLDITDRVDNGFSESGLLGFAFDPDWPVVPEAYVHYTATGPSTAEVLTSRISRFTSIDGGLTLEQASEEILLTVPQFAGNHNGGDLHFHPMDDYLFASFGDGGGGGDPQENGQNTSNLLSTIIRIDIDGGTPYNIPTDNPNFGNGMCTMGVGAGACAEIFAYGFRNPWRFSFDRQTGDLWTGDVGQGSWEEVNRVVSGGNYGWDEREGAHCFEPASGCDTTLLDPVAEYPNMGGASVTGGYVYRGNQLPELQGWYVFADFVTGDLYAIEANSLPTATPLLIENLGFSPSTFAEDVDGEVYVIGYGGNAIYQIVDAP